MIYSISNGDLKVSVSSLGAELQSIMRLSDKREYLYDGSNGEYWKRRSPVLFPIVGALIDDSYIYGDRNYTLPQHGFARDEEFSLYEKNEDSITFLIESNERTLLNFPFDFSLYISYSLSGNGLSVSWKVANRGNKEMLYSIGGHPAFIVPDDKSDLYLKFDKKPSFVTKIVGRYADEKSNVIRDFDFEDNYLKVTKDTFKNDAIVLDDSQVSEISLCEGKNEYIKVSFGSPAVGVWAPYKEGCPFICIEPWYGRCDSVYSDKIFDNKKYIRKLQKGESEEFSYKITIVK